MTTSAQALFGGRALAEWVRAGGVPERRIRGYFARSWWHACWFERNWRTQMLTLHDSSLPDDPIFILGLWRSGTTVLHELLVACTNCETPRTWQCFNPSTCFLTGRLGRQRMLQRPMDRGVIASDGPQEDEFAALLLGEPSVYRGFIDPRRLRDCGAALRRSAENPLPRWEYFVRGLWSSASDKRLILKSPSHTFRVPLLRALFPRAQFVWIGRHVEEVRASNLKMWRAMMERYALWACPPGIVDGFLSDMLDTYSAVLSRALDEMSRAKTVWVDFEHLQAQPARVLEGLVNFLEQDRPGERGELAMRIARALARVPIHAAARADGSVTGGAQRAQQLMGAARERFGLFAGMHRSL